MAPDQRWIARQEAVMAQAEALVLSYAPNARCRRLPRALLAGEGDPAGRFGRSSHSHLAPLIYAGLWGTEAPAYPLAAAAVSAGVGQLILHGVGTCMYPALWEESCPEEIREIGVFLFHSLPRLAITAIEAPSNTRVAMGKTLEVGLARVAASLDGASAPAPIEAVLVRAAELPATFAALSAQLAGAPPRVVEACRGLGQAIGLAAEFDPAGAHRWLIDPRVLFIPPDQSDGVPGQARARASPHDTSAAAAFRERALSALADAGLLEPGRGQLRTMIQDLTSEEEYSC
ncbi:MAG TPA: hypothetical protein VIJ28_14405 [Chloroflexota bacterium]